MRTLVFDNYQTCTVDLSALLQGTSDMTRIGTHTQLLTTPELWSCELDHSATTALLTVYVFMVINFLNGYQSITLPLKTFE